MIEQFVMGEHTIVIELDLRPGGVCRLTMVGPDGGHHPSDGHFEALLAS
jgi:uncharacterized protein YndB with AHSA1/START domain